PNANKKTTKLNAKERLNGTPSDFQALVQKHIHVYETLLRMTTAGLVIHVERITVHQLN
ncbi:hypothetical protein BLOT_004403, partial [Blomia tropicalis]